MAPLFIFTALLLAPILLTHQLGGSEEDSSAEDSSDPVVVERTLMRALELHRQSMSQTTRRPTRPKTSPEDRGARRILDALRQPSTSTSEIRQSHEDQTEEDDIGDPDYCPEVFHFSQRDVSLSTMKVIIGLHDAGRSEAQIEKQSSWYNRKYQSRFRECISRGYKKSDAFRLLSENVNRRFNQAREKGLQVRGYNIRRWAIIESRKMNITRFVASHSWLTRFKKRCRIRSRKVTKIVSQSHLDNLRMDTMKIKLFREQYGNWNQFFRKKLILNADQTGFNLEPSSDRTLSSQGERDTILLAGSSSKRTHSYTSQPIISRSGRIVGKLGLCLKEPRGFFGDRVIQRVEQMEQAYGNIKLFASTSGKMTSNLTADWTRQVLIPAVDECRKMSSEDDFDPPSINSSSLQSGGASSLIEEDNQCADEIRQAAGCSRRTWPGSVYCENQARHAADRHCHNNPDALVLIDAWAGNKPITSIGRGYSIKTLTIPERTTSEVQPLDVGFMRQYKIFVNRIVNQAHFDGLIRDVTSREGIIEIHSLIWDQFASPVYREMIAWCWHKTDPQYEDVTGGDKPLMVRGIQFAFDETKCSIESCENEPFIRCSHCGKIMCLHHFLARHCFHYLQEPESWSVDREEALRILGDIGEEDDDELMQLEDDQEEEMGVEAPESE